MRKEKNMANKAKTVPVDPDQFQHLKEYSNITGVPVESAVHEALSDFIECCVSTRLESIAARLHKA
jgi:hypothetical protein